LVDSFILFSVTNGSNVPLEVGRDWKFQSSNDERYWKVGRPNTSSVIYIVQSKIYHVIIRRLKLPIPSNFQIYYMIPQKNSLDHGTINNYYIAISNNQN